MTLPAAKRKSLHSLSLLVLLTGLAASGTHASTYTWKGGAASNNWNQPGNWTGNAAPPSDLHNTSLLFNASNGFRSPNASTAYSLYSLGFPAGADAYTIGGSALTLGAGGISQAGSSSQTINNPVTLGVAQTWNLTGVGTLTLGGGINNAGYSLTLACPGTSPASFSAAVSGAGDLEKSGSGALNVTGASTYTGSTKISAGTLVVGNGGSLSGTGSVTVGPGATLSVNGTGRVSTATGGALLLQGDLSGGGALSLDGSGSLAIGSLGTGTTNLGLFTQTGGTLTVKDQFALGGDTRGTSTGSLSGGSVSATSTYIGFSGPAAFTQTGGTLTNTGGFGLGHFWGAPSTYNLSGGSLSCTYASIGDGDTGTFTHTGGSFTVGIDFYLGSYATNCAYNLGGTGVLTTRSTNIANIGSSTFTQTGGTHTTASLNLSGNADSTGTYHLDGGTLQTAAIVNGSTSSVHGTSVFNFNGGKLQAKYNTTNFLQNLTVANVRAGGARIDTNGNSVTISQSLVHSTLSGDAATDGGLTQLGDGTLTLNGTHTYNGPTLVTGGTLALTAGGSLPNTAAVTIQWDCYLNNSGTIPGDLTLRGHAYGNGVYGNVTVSGTLDSGTVNGSLTVNPYGVVSLFGNSMTVGGPVVNNGTIRVSYGGQLLAGGAGSFVNNGVLDLVTGQVVFPANFVNNGIILDSHAVQVKSITRTLNASGGTASVTIALDALPGHIYRLQRSGSPGGSYANLVGVSTQDTLSNFSTRPISFTDPFPVAGPAFYRVQVDP